MFVNLNEDQKEEKFLELINYAQKIKNISLKNACINILNDYKNDLFVSYADSIDADVENIISYPRNTVNPILNTYMYESINGEK